MASAAGNLGMLLGDRGLFEEAERLNREALEIRSGLHGERSSSLTLSWVNLGYVLQQKGDLDGALAAYATAVEMGMLGDRSHLQLGLAAFWYGRALAERERHGEAVGQLRRALEIYEGVYGVEDAWSLDARVALADSLAAIDRIAEAEELLAVARESAPAGSAQYRGAIESLARIFERTDRSEEAAALRVLLAEQGEAAAG